MAKFSDPSEQALNGPDPSRRPVADLPPGPGKQRATTRQAPRLSHHKNRAAWFRSRVTWPMREAPVAKLQAERRRARRTLAAVAVPADWELAGPTNIGGRCTSLVCDPIHPERLWIGAAGGGVWFSADGGRTWRWSWTSRAPLQIGSLAIDPSNPGTIYCGTGEANLSADAYPGDGVYRSTNSGRTWQAWAPVSKVPGLPRRIGTVAVDPFDPQHVLVGGIGYGRVSFADDVGGLYGTRDGGTQWTRETFFSAGNYWCHQAVFDASTPGRIFVTVTGPGAGSGIYRSTDGGSTWVHLEAGLPSADSIGRTSLALAPSEPRILYALCADTKSDGVLGVFKSTDGGDTWADVAGDHFYYESQMSYGNTIAVDPVDPDKVICGGVDLHGTFDGGQSWCQLSQWDAKRGTSAYAHADHHQLLMPAAAPGRVCTANDGGLDVSEDGGRNWANRSDGLSVTMYYDVDVAQSDERVFGGGTQDNGTLITVTGGTGDAYEIFGGDGGWMVVDPRETGHLYVSHQFGGMYRFRNGEVRRVTPPFRDLAGVWMVYITLDPHDSDTVYTGDQRLYRTRTDGLCWSAISPVFDGSPISAIEVATADSRCIYVGTEYGGFFRSRDGGDSWSATLANGALPGVMITRIETHPNDAEQVFITVANFGNSHVFCSRDAGSTWQDIDRGILPDVPHHALLLRPDLPQELYVANDVGVFVSTDEGTTWQDATGRLPPAMIVDLVYHTSSKTLLAATYGRSIWRRQLS